MVPRLLLVLAFPLILALSACHKAEAKKGAAAIPVDVVEAVTQDIPSTYTAIGAVQPKHSVALKSQVDGIIQKLYLEEGADVKAGDLILSLDKRPFQNAVNLAKSELAQADAAAKRDDADAKRYTQLAEASVVSKEQYNTLMAQAATSAAALEGKRAALANAELQLGYADIRAPISGRLGQFSLREGSLVKANDAAVSLVTINQLAPIDITFSVPDSLFNAVQKGASEGTIHLTTKAKSGTAALEGKLIFINNAIDVGTGTLTLKAEFANNDLTLWPGAFASIDLELGRERNRVLVPMAAIQNGQQGPQIWVVKADDSVELRKVTLGTKSDGRVAVLEGVSTGEAVVTEGQLRLTPGAKVQRRGSQSQTPAKK